MTHEDETDIDFAPWPLIADACRDAARMLQCAWPAVLLCAALQSLGLGAGYVLLGRAYAVAAPPGGTALALAGAACCVLAGALLGVPPARRAALSLFAPFPTDLRVGALVGAYRDARPAYRSAAARLAALGIGALGVAFAAILVGALLVAVGGIVGSLITAVAALVLVPIFGIVLVPASHLTWARVCLAPGNPQADLAAAYAAARTPAARGDGGVWGAATLVVGAAVTSLALVVAAAAGLALGAIGFFLVGTASLMPLLCLHWALALRYAHAAQARGAAIFATSPPDYRA